MILTLLYMIATSIQSRRILFLKTHLRNLFQGNRTHYPSIMFYNKTLLDSCKESKSATDECENDEFMTSCLCSNKSDAKLDELLWYHGDMRLCTIYPQVDISSWLTYQYGRTVFPLYTNNCSETLFQSEYKLYILVEADLQSYKPTAAAKATKVEDYGLIITWTANKSIDLIIETDLDTVTKFLIASMEGQCYINNGLLLKRIETVLISGKPCLYNNDLFNSPSIKNKAEWETHIEKLRALSNTAKIAAEQRKSLEVEEFPGIVVYPENCITDKEVECIYCVASNEILESEGTSRVSTPTSISIPQQENQTLPNVTQVSANDNIQFQDMSRSDNKSVDRLDDLTSESKDIPHSENKSVDLLDNLLISDIKEIIQASCVATESSGKSSDQITYYSTKDSKATPSKSNFKQSMEEVTAKLSTKITKPPNILIFADSSIALNNVKDVLEKSLNTDKYIIYALSLEEARNGSWIEQATLVVVCGNVGNEVGNQIVEYILHGGKLLALCSDVLHILLPSFKTAEVRENELVHFSYGKWKHVRMMHHIFCYQASPIRTRFSQDHEDVKVSSLPPPTSANVKDKRGNSHSFNVKVLGTEETWHTPSILLASLTGNGGKIVFSQIHLEVDPMQYELEESKFKALKESNAARIEILNDLLNVHLGIELQTTPRTPVTYTPAFFLGHHQLKQEMLEKLKDVMQSNDILKLPNIEIQFCRSNTTACSASATLLPIMLHQCPDNFSTIEYFENLTSKEFGRLVIYADVMTLTMDILNGHQFQHGLAVIARQQTQGRGRNKNKWVSPKGCAMFSLEIDVPTNTILGKCISILQNLVSVAIVSAIKSLPGYEDIDLRLKWPNDIYAGDKIKIGGIMISTQIMSDLNICNVGVGINLFNEKPTCCINDIIKMFNKVYHKELKTIAYEQYFAIVFSEIERWYNIMQSGRKDIFLDAYYTYWLHSDENVTVVSTSGTSKKVKILGIDEYGYLRVRDEDGDIFSVHSDGNSFDIFKGLIIPK
ncbi:holocarboxylase synthetase-like protein isoform X2 [Colletes latitarsis]|uniref:holocarboxylase synthetase-like protein isoform X2 n=1 Tax=Colletes latitarsis TaxID=2605962 RepID=UPI004035572D